jgi:hypothetical protein
VANAIVANLLIPLYLVLSVQMLVYFKVWVLLGGDGIHGGDLLCREDMLWSVDDAMDRRQMGCGWIRYVCTRADPVTCNLGKCLKTAACELGTVCHIPKQK